MPGLNDAANIFKSPAYLKIGDYGAVESSCVDIGSIDEEGFKISVKQTYIEAKSGTNYGIAKKEVLDRNVTVEAKMQETDIANIARAIGADPASVVGTAPAQYFGMGSQSSLKEYTAYLYGKSPNGNSRVLWIPKCVIAPEAVEMDWSRSKFTKLAFKLEGMFDVMQPSGYELFKITESSAVTGNLPAPTSNPVNAATGVAATIHPTLTFTRDIQANLITAGNVFLVDTSTGAPVAASLSYANKVITITPAANLAALTKHIIVVSQDMADIYGNKLASMFTASFTTA